MTQPTQQFGAQQPIGQQQGFGQPSQEGYGQQLQAGAGQQQTIGQQPQAGAGGAEQYLAGLSQPTGGGQLPPQQTGFGPQTQQPAMGSTGQQAGQIGAPGGQQPVPGADLKLEEGISDEMRVALHDFVQSATVASWCAERCIDEGPQMAECIRLCRDVADLATLNVQLLSRDSVFGPEVAEVFAVAAEACAQECRQHSQRHCQECAEVLDRAARSTQKMLTSLGSTQQ